MGGLIQLGEPAEHLGYLAVFLDLVRVPLPEWLLEQEQVDHGQQHHRSKKTPSMAKQFGSLGKKFRKNLAKITKTVGHRSKDTVDYSKPRIVSSTQPFILGAVIHNRECLPYQHEMIDNYLVDARQRFDLEQEARAKQKAEQIEQNEKLKRDIYLNGGFVDCVNPGCVDQGTAETNYLCKSCYHEQTLGRSKNLQSQKKCYAVVAPPPPGPQQPINSTTNNNKKTMETSAATTNGPISVNSRPAVVTVGHIVPVAVTSPVGPMRVKLPPNSNGIVTSHPCKNSSCEFYGTPELDFFCSKCSKNLAVMR